MPSTIGGGALGDEGIGSSRGASEGDAQPPVDPPPPGDAPVGSSAPPPPGAVSPAIPPPPPAPGPPPPDPTRVPPPPSPVVADRWRSLQGVTKALTVFFWLVAAGAVFGIVAFALRIRALDDIIDGTLDADTVRRAHDADDVVGAATGILFFLSFVILVLIIIWTFRAAKNNEALGRRSPRLKPGWGIAGWLIPLANLVIPVLILQDLWRGSTASTPRENPSWRANPGSALVGWYWAFFLAASVRYGVGRTEARLAFTGELRGLRTHDIVAIVGLVASIVAAVLGVMVVRRIATRQEECLRAQQAAWATDPGRRAGS